MPTRALGALLAAIAAAAFVVSILSGAWWDGHPRVEGRVYTAKDVHIGLLGGEGCNTGGIGDCQPLPLGTTFTTVAYGELGGLALTTAFAILIAGAAWRVAESRKRLAKLGMVIASLAAAGALGLLILGPQIKTTQNVVPPIGWGFFLFGGGIVAMFSACLATLKVEREPLRLKSPPKPAPHPATPQPFEPAPQLRPLYDMQPQPFVPPAPQQAFVPPVSQPFVPPPAPPPFVAPPPAVPARPASPSPSPAPQPPPSAPAPAKPFVPPVPPAGPLSKPPPSAPIASPGRPELPRTKPPTAPPPPRAKPGTMPPAPFASPAIASSALAQPRKSSPSIPAPNSSTAQHASKPNSSANASASMKAPSVAPPADPLGATIPAPARIPPPPRVAKISVPPPRRDANPPTPTPSVITSAPRPDGPAPRSSQPTMTHTVPPMPQIDTPPPAIVRGGTQNDDSLETGMRETEIVTAVEIDHEAKARFEEEQRLADGATVATPPLVGDDTDATQTATAEQIVADSHDALAAPPAKATKPTPPAEPDGPFVSLSAAARAAEQKAAAAKAEAEAAKKVPLSTAPASLPPPKSAAIPASGPTPACPQCEAPMAWVEEHLRFYCKSCRMYF